MKSALPPALQRPLSKGGPWAPCILWKDSFVEFAFLSYLKWLCNKLLKLTLYLHPQKGFYQARKEKRGLEKWEERVE